MNYVLASFEMLVSIYYFVLLLKMIDKNEVPAKGTIGFAILFVAFTFALWSISDFPNK